MDNVEFTGNEATTSGGGIRFNSGEIDATDCDFSLNTDEDLWDQSASVAYEWGANASFSCDDDGCATD